MIKITHVRHQHADASFQLCVLDFGTGAICLQHFYHRLYLKVNILWDSVNNSRCWGVAASQPVG